jgi:hypothetical protein
VAARTPPVLALARREPKDGDMTAKRVCLPAIVAVTGVDLLGERVQARILVGIGNLGRHKCLVAELAFGVCLQVVIPLRVFGSSAVRGDQDWIGSIVKVGDLDLSRLPRFGTGGHERCARDYRQGGGVTPAGCTVQPRVDARVDVAAKELSCAGAPEAHSGAIHPAALLIGIDVMQRHARTVLRFSRLMTCFCQTSPIGVKC